MSEQVGKRQQTVGDELARRVEARGGAESAWAEALRELGTVSTGRCTRPWHLPSPRRWTARSAASRTP